MELVNSRPRRNLEDVIRETEEKLQRQKNRLFISAQMNNPALEGISESIEKYDSRRNEAKKGFNGNPIQTFDNRRKSKNLWINVIDAEEKLAIAQIKLSEVLIPLYEEVRIQAAQKLVNNESADSVSNWVNSERDRILGLSEVSDLMEQVKDLSHVYEETVEARENFTRKLKVPKGTGRGRKPKNFQAAEAS